MKKFHLLFLILIYLTSQLSAKKYVWLHGLEGEKDANTWDIYKQHLTSTNGFILEYPSNNSIPGIAGLVYNNQLKSIQGNDDVILIGHSMGGLVARSMQLLSPNVKAIITSGTAHHGSTLVRNTLNGKTYNFFATAINRANKAIDQSLWSGIFSGFPVTTIAAPIVLPVTIFKSAFVTTTLSLLRGVYNTGIGIYSLSHQCIIDMLPTSRYLQTLNSTPIGVPIINIYGSEDSWQVVRAMGTLSKVSDVKKIANMDRNYDNVWIPHIYAGLSYVSQIQQAHNVVYNALALPAVFLPWIWLTRELVLKARYNWDEMYRYINIGMHGDFATNMGATDYKLQDYCLPKGLDLTKLTCTRKYLPVITDNDGILGKKDVLLSPTQGNYVVNVRIPGVNHQEMGNHIEMRKFLEGVINQRTHGEVFSK